MNMYLTQHQNHLVRDAFERMIQCNNSLKLVESHSNTSDYAAAVILMCRRDLSSVCNDISDAFGSDWTENQ